MKAIQFLMAMPRTRKIVQILKEKYNFDISEDLDTIMSVLNIIGRTKLTNEQIADKIMEDHTVNVKDLYPAKEK